MLQAIFLHYIGVKWSVFFKRAFLDIYRQGAWKNSRTQVSKTDRMRRQYFLGGYWTQDRNTLETKRENTHRNRYFAHQLLDYERQQIEVAEGEEEAEYSHHVQPSKKRKMAQSASLCLADEESVDDDGEEEEMGFMLADDDGDNDDNDASPGPKRPMEAKQDLLHLLSTDIIINTRLNGEVSCFRTVFESWNSLLPHQAVLEVLNFFGVSEKWKAFFTKFLKAPLKFMDDGPSVKPHLRQRGTPASHALSDMFGESVLFCLDFAVNQTTDGALLHRLYDDIWFWSKDYEKCVQAWDTLHRFTEVMGVEVGFSPPFVAELTPADESHSSVRRRRVAFGSLVAAVWRWTIGYLRVKFAGGFSSLTHLMADSKSTRRWWMLMLKSCARSCRANPRVS